MTTTYLAQRYQAHKWHPVCKRDSASKARNFAQKQHPDAAIRIMRITREILKPIHVR